LNLKQFKPVYWLYNLLHYKALRHNREPFKKFNVHKSLIGSISSKDFPDKESRAWLDTGNSRTLAPTKESFDTFSAAIQSKIAAWSDNGYMILESFIDPQTCDAINNEIDRLIKNNAIRFTNKNKLMFVHKKSSLINSIAQKKELLDILQFLLGKEVVLFQTINFITGSEQRAHSDSIHMTTYPLGYLIAAWLALEDTTEKNGPLFYFPGSHKLPFLLNSDYNEGQTPLTLGKKTYTDYEDLIDRQIEAKQFPKKEFYAKKGDLLIWHANLLHGGAPIIDKHSTRKSMVMHYYAKDVIKYHDITERPSLLDKTD
jgi:ectoine hydroxylase-related dioxygenase (phytanoyl-CoA dioxygenase family)